MQSEMPFFDSVEDALKASVQALGGAKAVGTLLWPDKTVTNATTSMLDSLNPDRAAKLDGSQIIFIFRLAKEAGCMAPFLWFANECGFDATPVNQEVVVDRLTDVIESATKTLSQALTQLEKYRVNS